MGIWIDILRAAARGDARGARLLLSSDLPSELRKVSFEMTDSKYSGPLPKAVRRFISRLPHSERPQAESRRDDFVDYILEDVLAAAERTLALVEICVAGNPKTLDDIVGALPWSAGLKRDTKWKRQRVVDELRSMLQANVPLPKPIVDILGDQGEPRFPFNEIAFATAPERLQLSWTDFKEEQQIDERFVCMRDSENDTGTADEGFDYGSIPMARVVARTAAPSDFEATTDLHIMGAVLGPQIDAIMESIHSAQPLHGYYPIAWHNVFWNVASEYEVLLLALEQRDPFCETDQDLTNHIVVNYLDVVGTSRPSITRRRLRLYEACEELIQTRVRDYLNAR